MRHCKKCGQQGHNSRTCGKEGKINPVVKGTRQCRKCGNCGHNIRTCKNQAEYVPEKYRILQEIKGPKVDRIPVDGVIPQKGLWMVNPERNRVAGRIMYVKRNGCIVWHDFEGIFVESKQKDIVDSGYKYLSEFPTGDEWRYLRLGGWEKNSTLRNINAENEC